MSDNEIEDSEKEIASTKSSRKSSERTRKKSSRKSFERTRKKIIYDSEDNIYNSPSGRDFADLKNSKNSKESKESKNSKDSNDSKLDSNIPGPLQTRPAKNIKKTKKSKTESTIYLPEETSAITRRMTDSKLFYLDPGENSVKSNSSDAPPNVLKNTTDVVVDIEALEKLKSEQPQNSANSMRSSMDSNMSERKALKPEPLFSRPIPAVANITVARNNLTDSNLGLPDYGSPGTSESTDSNQSNLLDLKFNDVNSEITPTERALLKNIMTRAMHSKKAHISHSSWYIYYDKIFSTSSRVLSLLVGSTGIGSLINSSLTGIEFWLYLSLSIIALTSSGLSTIQDTLEFRDKAKSHKESSDANGDVTMKIAQFLSTPYATRKDVELFMNSVVLSVGVINANELIE